jgi:formylmethanofuran dehydrogenase subunit E
MELLHKRDKLGNYICSTCDLKKTTLSKNKSNEQSDKYIICSICQKEIPKQRCIVNEENIICLDCYYKEN